MRHIRNARVDSTPTADCTNAAKGVECGAPWHACARHQPERYAEMMARHAIDSIGPAERYHSSNQFGR